MDSIGIIGAGNMGRAIGHGLRANSAELKCGFFDTDQSKAEESAKACEAKVYGSYEELFRESEILLIAVKPQHLERLFSQLPAGHDSKKYISIVAGKPIDYFRSALGSDQIIRFMPNLAATVGAAVVGIAYGPQTDENFRRDARTVASAIGSQVELPENLLSAFTGLSGSGIAYVFAFLHAMALGGTDAGIPYSQSLNIAYGTVEGAVKLLREEGVSPSEYLTRVTSAGGTTIKGVKQLENGRFTHTVMEAIEAAAVKAKEFEK